MKAKKLAMAITALTVSSVSAFAFAACGGNNPGGEHTEHNYTWTVETPATCTTDGVEKGTCSCGETTTRPISASNAHQYGDWKIISMPSEHGKGKAQKVCANDTAHVIEVELPAFDRAGKGQYASFKEVDEHFVNFTYAHESGNITATTVASVKDAIALGVKNKAKVVSGNAEAYHDYKIYDTQARGEITYEFGADHKYMHVDDNVMDKREFFFDLNEDGTMFPVYLEWKTISKDGQDENAVEHIKTDYRETLNMKDAIPEMMGGFGYFFTWLNGDHKEYGIENFINYIYNEYYEVNTNEDAAASVEIQSDGTLLYKFSVNIHSVMNIDLLHKIDVTFTLDANNVLKTATVRNRTWNNPVQNPSNPNLWTVPAGSDYVVMDQYTIAQGTERAAGAEVPTNPYKLEDMLITSYDMVLDGQKLQEGTTIEVDANTLTQITLDNIQPAETFNLNFDEITVTLTDSEGSVKDCIASATDLDDGDILAQVLTLRSYDGVTITATPTLQIKSLLAGEFTLTIKSAKLTKTIKLNVNTIAPSEFGANVYEYDAMKSVWVTDNFNTEFTVYAGQGLNFTSYVPHPFYEETGFNLSVIRGEDEDIEIDYTFGDNTIDGVKVKKFVANVAGDYIITLTNLKQNSEGEPVTAQITVHVVAAPDMADVLKGTYFNLDEGFEITFTPSVEGATDGVATLITGKGGSSETNTVLTYSYTGEKSITLTYVSGALEEYQFNLEFDDAYNMFLKFVTSRGTTRVVYMYNVVPNRIVGTYRMTKSEDTATEHVVNIAGKYSVSADSYSNVFYGIFDVRTGRIKGENVKLTEETAIDLEIGEAIKVWTIGLDTDNQGSTVGKLATQYTITLVEEAEAEA